jgi:hypothetical protein
MAGLTTLVTSWVNVARGDAPLWTGLGQLPFSYSDLAGASPALPPGRLNGSVGGVNIVAAAIAVIVVSGSRCGGPTLGLVVSGLLPRVGRSPRRHTGDASSRQQD